jgi:hypothetical protein
MGHPLQRTAYPGLKFWTRLTAGDIFYRLDSIFWIR